MPRSTCPPSSEIRSKAAAPELATLALLDSTLSVRATALRAEHPTLDHDLRPEPEPPSLREARRLLAAAHRLRAILARYKTAVIVSIVRNATTPTPSEARRGCNGIATRRVPQTS